LQRIANAERLKQLEKQLGNPLPATVREELARVGQLEVSVFDPRAPGEVQGEIAYDGPLPGVQVTIL
jgi:hypothetical protein